jgi:F-type H+-transporting ATPase subunit alpha
MSITDGQIIFDLGIFRQGFRPAVNSGLSVSRVGGQAQTTRQKRLSSTLFKQLARYRQAEEFSHFSSQLSKETRIDLTLGKYILQVLQQPPEERHSLVEQMLMLETVMLSGGERDMDIAGLKQSVKEVSHKVKDVKDEATFDKLEAELLKKHSATQLQDKKSDSEAAAPAEQPEEATHA